MPKPRKTGLDKRLGRAQRLYRSLLTHIEERPRLEKAIENARKRWWQEVSNLSDHIDKGETTGNPALDFIIAAEYSVDPARQKQYEQLLQAEPGTQVLIYTSRKECVEGKVWGPERHETRSTLYLLFPTAKITLNIPEHRIVLPAERHAIISDQGFRSNIHAIEGGLVLSVYALMETPPHFYIGPEAEKFGNGAIWGKYYQEALEKLRRA